MMKNIDQEIDLLKGTIYGQAIGDALGLGTEFMTDEDMAWKYPNGITHYSDIFQDRHRKRWKIGDWTDDTDMMLCIANAVVKNKNNICFDYINHNPYQPKGSEFGKINIA